MNWHGATPSWFDKLTMRATGRSGSTAFLLQPVAVVLSEPPFT